MRISSSICVLAAAVAAVASAQPVVSALENNYSYTLPGLPTYGIAQGSVFDIFGTNIGPSQTPVLPDLSKGPLVTTLNGVSISVTVNGTTVQAIPYYVSAGQIAAILPSNTPVGSGILTVSYNGQTSAATSIQVVASAVGLDTLNGSGSGIAVAQDASNGYAILGPNNAANPGEVLVLWGTGVGPASGDETKYPFPQVDLTASNNVKVYIGGQLASVAYAGRSQFPGVDQINVTVPAGVSGCNVSVLVQTGAYVSNTATIPVAASGRTCSDQASTGLSQGDLQTLLSKPTVKTGVIVLNKTKTQTAGYNYGGLSYPPTNITSDSAIGSFNQFNTSQLATGTSGVLFQQASVGSCTTYQLKGAGGASSITATVLDAGTISMTWPNGTVVTVPKETTKTYFYGSSDAPGAPLPPFIPANGGTFSFANSGGVVGTFNGASITAPPLLNWTNSDAISAITKAQGVTVNWDASTPYTGFVTVAGSSQQVNTADFNKSILTGFSCAVPYNKGTFTVPAYVLLGLATSQTGSSGVAFPTGALSLSLNVAPVPFTASGLDYAVVDASSTIGKSVTYQ